MHVAHNSSVSFVAFDYCTIFFFFLQISVDKHGKLRIMGVAGEKRRPAERKGKTKVLQTVKRRNGL